MAQGLTLSEDFGLSGRGQSDSTVANRKAALEMLNRCLFQQGKASSERVCDESLCDPGFYAQFSDYVVNHAVSATKDGDSALMNNTILGYLSQVKEWAKDKTQGREPGRTFWKNVGWYTTLRQQITAKVQTRCIQTAQPISEK